MIDQNHSLRDVATRLRRHVREDCVLSDTLFETLALDLFAAQFTLNAPYGRFAEARRATPETVRHWQDIPAVPTTAFKEVDLTCLAAADRCGVFHSSGTTGHRPSRHFHSTDSLALYAASALAWFRPNVLAPAPARPGVTPAIRNVVILTPPPLATPHSSLVRMFEFVRRELNAPVGAFLGTTTAEGAWALDLEAATAALETAVRCGAPLLVLGTAFSFVHLLDHLTERQLVFPLPPGSRAMETGGYKGRSRSLPQPELHALITRRLGLPPACIIREYGMSELSSQAYATESAGYTTKGAPLPIGWGEGEDGRASDGSPSRALLSSQVKSPAFHFPPWARARVISPETSAEVAEGETGLLRVYDLANAFSVLAVQTEDLAVRWGAGFALIGRAEAAEPRGCSLAAA